MSAVAIVVVTYDPGHHLATFLQSVHGAVSEPAQVVVSDNGSTDHSLADARRDHPETRIVVNAGNLGYGGAVNAARGVLDDDTEWIVIVNPDVVLSSGSIDRLLATGRADATVGSVGPLVRQPDGVPYPSARSLPTLGVGIGHALLANAMPDNRWSRQYRPDLDHETAHPRPAGWLSGSCLLVRREAFDRVHGFDERFFMYFEDVELCRQLGLAGYTNLFDPGAEVMHVGAHSTKTHSARMLRAHHRSAYLYLSGVYSAWYWAPIRLALGVGLAMRSRFLTYRG